MADEAAPDNTDAEERLAGTEFQDICEDRLRTLANAGALTWAKYGVLASYQNGEWRPVSSLPDIEGVLPGGRQFVLDCKVVSASSFSLTRYRNENKGPYRRQLNHLLSRGDYGAASFFLIHFSSRTLKTKADDAETFAFPVTRRMPWWDEFLFFDRKSITRDDCRQHGVEVAWDYMGRDRTARPDVLGAIEAIMERIDCLPSRVVQ